MSCWVTEITDDLIRVHIDDEDGYSLWIAPAIRLVETEKESTEWFMVERIELINKEEITTKAY